MSHYHHYYNDNDAYACQWLRNLSENDCIPAGLVDERSITDVNPEDLGWFRQLHFFAGIGGWPLAFKLAGWPSDQRVLSASCPCQPFSAAGKQLRVDDERHLWPEMFRIIRSIMPPIVVGEQVAKKAGFEWFDGVCSDLEGSGYSCWAYDLTAGGIGAPHIRQRLYWYAIRHEQGSWVGDPDVEGLEDWQGLRRDVCEKLTATERTGGEANAWSDSIILRCSDGKQRRVGSRVRTLAAGIPRSMGSLFAELERLGVDAKRAKKIIKHTNIRLAAARSNRIGRLRGYGNSIVPPLAVEFIHSIMDHLSCLSSSQSSSLSS